MNAAINVPVKTGPPIKHDEIVRNATIGERLSAWVRGSIPGALGFAGFLIVWEIVGRVVNSGRQIPMVPPPTSVVDAILTDGWSYYRPNIGTTLGYALDGWVWGNLLAVAAAGLVLMVPQLEIVILQLGVTTYCLPLVAVAPLVFLVYEGPTPYRIITILFVFFTTLVLTLAGLRSADPTSLDVVRAYGGGRWQGLRRVRLISALPSIFAGFKIAGPAAVLGAVLAEFFQPADSGLGVGIIRSQQQLEISRTWGIAVVSTMIGAAAYLLTTFVARVATPWAPKLEV
ncbi:MAG: ABC transporter permease subunit [Microthrixaceae bacterium]